MAARRILNNRRYWPRSSLMYPPMNIIEAVNRNVGVLTTMAVSNVTPSVHDRDKAVTTLIMTRQAVRSIQ